MSPDQLKWLNKLWGLTYDIEYRTGRDNAAADALSRQHEGVVFSLSTLESPLIDQVKESWRSDGRLQQLIMELERDPLLHKHYS